MYVDPAEIEADCLRQGDVIEAVPFPIFDDELVLLSRIDRESGVLSPLPKVVVVPREHRNRKDCVTAQVKMRFSLGVVLAHCCELELRNGKCYLPTIPIARLIPVKTSISSDTAKMASLQENKDPRNSTDPGYVDYFYLEPHERLGSVGWLVDYCQISSVPNTEYTSLIQRRVLQLSDRDRVKFKIKLAVFMGSRLTDEEVEKGLESPW